ncbi:MAG: S9 family peptidase [Burkholderiales bacterium]|nr:S9 family peptidase [Burkholderiales bacterium]MDE2275895.1 S9 family peptidase [Burkholderiales bacterium]
MNNWTTRLAAQAASALAGLLVAVQALQAQALPALPVAPVRPVTDTYFGTPVVDDYRYMENLADPEVQAWMKAQAQATRARLDALPGRQALLERIHALRNADAARGGFVRRGQRWFYEAFEPGAQLPRLYWRDGLQGEEHLLLDPAALGAGSTTHYALDYFEPSGDGKLVAYGISAGGSEASVLHVMDVATGRVLAERITRANGSVVAWRPDNRSFFYLRYGPVTPATPPALREYDARTYLHQVGTHADGDGDAVVFGRGVQPGLDVPEGQGTYVLLAPGSKWALAVANRNMDNNPATFYVAPLAQVNGPRTPWRKIAGVADGVTDVALHGDTLYFLSQKDAPRFRLLATPLARPDVARARVVIPEGTGVLTAFALARDGLYARVRDGAVSHVLRLADDGSGARVVPMPFEGNVGAPVVDPREPGALMVVRGWLQSPRVVFYDPARGASADTGLIPPSKIDVSAMAAKEVFATSYDGTRVPLSLIYRRDLVRDGSHPTLLIGYGSYGISLEPRFSATSLAWIERGGVVAIAHVRGGGEYGEAWHAAGQKLTKLNTVFDFIACAQYLIDEHYTVAAKIAGNGGSAGGITVGGALTWRPDLFGVILDEVGMSDTLRAETEPNGPPNVPEFGSVATEAGFHGLYAMSPYVHVRDGVRYPAVMFSTGANDPRVSPWQMAKMAARVQAATASGRPVLLRVDYDAGHGIGSSASQVEAKLADLWSFALWQMGDPAFQPTSAAVPAAAPAAVPAPATPATH